MGELVKKHYRINIDNYAKYFSSDEYPEHYVREDWFYLVDGYINGYDVVHNNIFTEHNNEYLAICYWNLREKYLRGQKDFTKECFDKLYNFVKHKFNKEGLYAVCDI